MEIKRHYRPTKVKKYEARWYVDKRLKCRFFATEKEREKFIAEFSEQVARNGKDLLLGYEAARMRRWQEASRMAPEADPVEVMRFWLASNRPVLIPMKLGDAIAAYLRHLESMQRDRAYRKHIERHLHDFHSAIGERNVHEIGFQEIADYILPLPYQPVTKRHYRRDINGAYAWWIEQQWAIENPVKRVRLPQIISKEPGMLTVEQAERLLRCNERADPEICGLLALGLFAGMRTSAIARLAYHELDFAQRGIHTPAEKTKKRRRQWIEDLPDNLWAWLERTPPQAFELTLRQYLHRRSEALKRAGLLVEADDIAQENRKRTERGDALVNWPKKPDPKITVDDPGHGWLLPVLLETESHCWGRWDHWMRTMEAGHVLDEPIPQIDFCGAGNAHVGRMHEKSLDSIAHYGGWQGWDSWRLFDYYLDWLLYGFGDARQKTLPDEPSEGAFSRLWQVFCLEAMIAWPTDMFGDLMAENRYGRGAGFFPTPECVVELMTRMTFPPDEDFRTKAVCDPCVGTGRMLLHASNYSYRLYAQDINPTVLKACIVNGYCFAPWLVRPFSFLKDMPGDAVEQPVTAAPPAPPSRPVLVEKRAPIRINGHAPKDAQMLLFDDI